MAVGLASEDIVKIGSALVGGGVLTKVIDAMLNRGQMRAYTMGAVDKAVETAFASVTKQLEVTDRRLTEAENEREEAKRHRAQCEVDLADMKDKIGEHRTEMEKLIILHKSEIDQLMAGAIAAH